MKTYLIPMTKSGALISGNKNWNQSTPSFLSLSHLPDIMETSCYDLVGNDIPQPDPYSEIQENYGENLIVATEQKVKAWTFYCDSVEWDDNALWGNTSSEEKRNCLKTVNKSGDGSKENPWRNVNYALQKLECLADRTCCQYFQLIITGKVNYTVYCFDDYYLSPVDSYFENRVILDFANADMSINRSDIRAIAFYKLRDVYIKNCKAFVVSEASAYGISSCDNLKLSDSLIDVTSNNENAYGVYESGTSIYRSEINVQTNADYYVRYACGLQTVSREINIYLSSIRVISLYDKNPEAYGLYHYSSNSIVRIKNCSFYIDSYGSSSFFYSKYGDYENEKGIFCYGSKFEVLRSYYCYFIRNVYATYYQCDFISNNTLENTDGIVLIFSDQSISVERFFYKCNAVLNANEYAYGTYIPTGQLTTTMIDCNISISSQEVYFISASGYANDYLTAVGCTFNFTALERFTGFGNCTCEIINSNITAASIYISLFYGTKENGLILKNCILTAKSEATGESYASAYIIRECEGVVVTDCQFNATAISSNSDNHSEAFAVAFYRSGSYSQEPIVYNSNFNVSASASATPSSSGYFYETEQACGFYDSSGCHDPCHHVYRTKDGTTDYCNS